MVILHDAAPERPPLGADDVVNGVSAGRSTENVVRYRVSLIVLLISILSESETEASAVYTHALPGGNPVMGI